MKRLLGLDMEEFGAREVRLVLISLPWKIIIRVIVAVVMLTGAWHTVLPLLVHY